MPTTWQLINVCRKKWNKKKIDWILQGCPQKRAVITKIRTAKPKKPNSAIWKVAKVWIVSTRISVVVYIPGQSHTLHEHAQLLIRGGWIPDLPGVHYKAIKGKLDFPSRENFDWKKWRSKFGVKKDSESKR